jgi:CRP-like cAMP-binding protein
MKRRDQKIELLAHLALFAECGEPELLTVAKVCDIETAQAGDLLSVEGEIAGWWRLLVDGQAAASHDGQPTGLLRSGDWWGERSALNGDPSSVTVIALTSVTSLVFSRRLFRSLLREHPQVALRVVSQLAQREAPYERLISA